MFTAASNVVLPPGTEPVVVPARLSHVPPPGVVTLEDALQVSVPPPVLVTVMVWFGGLAPTPVVNVMGDGLSPILGRPVRFIVTNTNWGAFVAFEEPTVIRPVYEPAARAPGVAVIVSG